MALVSPARFGKIPAMQAAVKSDFVSVADYLAAEATSAIISALEEYVLVAQAAREVTVFRRANGWRAETVSGAKTKVTVASLKLAIPLTALYEGV